MYKVFRVHPGGSEEVLMKNEFFSSNVQNPDAMLLSKEEATQTILDLAELETGTRTYFYKEVR